MARPRVGLAAWNDSLPTQAIWPASTPIADKLFGLHGHERYQFFPERLLRSIYEGLQQDPWDPQTGTFTPQAIGTAMDFAMLGSGGAPFRPAPTESFGMAAARSAKLPMDTASRMAR